ncbi:acyl-CoA dehydrogenase family protein [Pseudonocardia sp. ICBG1293]|uniref:acyl-CoA dehydrogenase family protein n=1 Tax=Pseudonocardia sp. ICBG1293 TaxID=2844382 RepID=UPI001CCCAAFB|nr:acyl-CoA dehydrogenase family protein [Pseudonocardia sp. ICBG1293]
MDFQETDEERDLRSAVAAIAGKFGSEYYLRCAREGRHTHELWSAMGEAGFLGVNVAEEHGGGGGGLVELSLVCEEAAAQGAPLLLVLVSAAISAEVIGEFGSDELRRRWLPGLADGSTKVVFAITEPDAGSNTHRMATHAARDGDDWVLNGTKHYISGTDDAEAVLVVARTGRNPDGRAQLSLFVVPVDSPGLTRTPLPVDLIAPDKQHVLHFDDVRVPAGNLVGQEGDGFRQVFRGLNPERITGAALGVGVARFALARAAEYARTRQVWDVPIGAHQGVSHPLARARIETELAALMTRKAAWLHDRGLPAGEESNMAKYAAAEAATHAVEAAMQTHGGNGLASEYGLIPYWGMARLMQVAPVNREMILNHVAQHGLGLPRSY